MTFDFVIFCLEIRLLLDKRLVIAFGLVSLAWNVRDGCCVSTKLWDVPDTTPAMSVNDEVYLRFYSQFYCEVMRLVSTL